MRHTRRWRVAARWLAGGTTALLLLAPGDARAQAGGTITGRVTEGSGGTPIAAVQLQVIGTQLGTQTNQNGEFTIRGVPTGTQVIRALRVGFGEQRDTVTVAAGQTVAANIVMRPVAVTLDPVVTTATGEQRRVEVGNAIGRIDADRLVETRAVTSMGDLLTARTPGVQVLAGTQTGTGARVRIRGTKSLSLSNDPIYVIDGVRMESSTNSASVTVGGPLPSRVSDLNPEEIESIEVVRGPSAATLYGTDAANGVIVIKTKRGVAGRPQWTFYTEQGQLRDEAEWPTNFTSAGTVDATGDPTFACFLYRQVAANDEACTRSELARFDVARADGITPIGTGRRQQYGLQVSGGSETVRYFVSGEWEDETGTQQLPGLERRRLRDAGITIRDYMERPNTYTKASARANLSMDLPGNADLAVNSAYVTSALTFPQSDNNITAWTPTLYGGAGLVDPADHTTAYGFFAPGDLYQEHWQQDIDRFLGSVNGNWRPASWLALRGNFGVDFTHRVDSDLCRFGECADFGTNREGFKVDNRTAFYTYTVDVAGTASFQLSDAISSKTTLGAQFYRNLFDRNGVNAAQLPPGATSASAGAQPGAWDPTTFGEATTESRTLGAFVEQAFGLNDRLFLTAGVRSDDNSAFGADFDVVYYPKVSASWVLSEEPFFPSPRWLDQLRLRSAYGASGQQPGPTDALQFYTTTTGFDGGVESPGVVFSALGNTELKPERSTEFEAGVDWTLFGSRLSGELTYYDTRSRDALVQRILPPSIGAGAENRFENLGATRNWGWEWLLNAQLVQRAEFGWDVTLNGSHNSNRLVDLGDVPPIEGEVISQREGFPLNAYFYYPLSFSDADGDGIIGTDEITVGADKVFLGYSQPRLELSLGSGIEFWNRRIRLAAQADYKGGHVLLNDTERIRCSSFGNCRGLNDESASLYEQARAVATRTVAGRQYIGYFEDGDFVRLREVSLNVALPEEWAARWLRARRVGVNLAARNVAVWTDYTGLDPESSRGQGDVQDEFLTSAAPTYYLLRLTVGF